MQAVLFACFIPANICVTGSDLQINGMPLEAKRPQRETIFIGGAAAISKMRQFDLSLDSQRSKKGSIVLFFLDVSLSLTVFFSTSTNAIIRV